MDRKKSRSEMVAKIEAMKQELAKKEKKLRKSQRVAKIKAHVQQKLKELNNNAESESSNKTVADDENDNKKSSTVAEKEGQNNIIDTYSVREKVDALSLIVSRRLERENSISNESTPDRLALLTTRSTGKEKCSKLQEKGDSKSRPHPNQLHPEKCLLPNDSCTYISHVHSDSRDNYRTAIPQGESVRGSGNSVSELQMAGGDDLHSQMTLESSGDTLNIESPLISPSFKSQDRKKRSSSRRKNKSQHDLSNSQFLEILGLSQPLTLTPKDKLKTEDKTEAMELASGTLPIDLEYELDSREKETLEFDNPDNNSQYDASFRSSGVDVQTATNCRSSSLSDEALHSQPNFLYDYTELDAIDYSQFELTEDFLSENSSQSQSKVKRSGLKPLVKRKSPRISSISYSSSSAKPDACDISQPVMSKREYNSKKKVAAVMSAFQFLIDEAKKKAKTEFYLPSSFQWLKSCKVDYRLMKNEEDQDSVNNYEKGIPTGGGHFSLLENNDNSDKSVMARKNSADMSSYSASVENECQGHSLQSQDGKSEENLTVQKSPSHSQDTAHLAHDSLQSCVCSGQLEILVKESSQSQESDIFVDKETISFVPSSFCGATLSRLSKRKHNSLPSDFRVTMKTAKTVPREMFNCKKYDTDGHVLSSKVAKDEEYSENTGDAPISLSHSQSQQSEHLHISIPLERKPGRIDLLALSCQNDSNFKERQNSPHLREISNFSESCHAPSSSSTPIPTAKSRFKSANQNIPRSLHLSTNASTIENSPCEGNESILQQGNVNKFNSTGGHLQFKEDGEEGKESAVGLSINCTNFDDTLPSGQKTLKADISRDISLIASPILKSPAAHASTDHIILPWKKISRTAFTPLRILEKESNEWDARNLLSPSFIYGKPNQRGSLPRPVTARQDLGCKGKGAALYFAGCFQSCSEDSVIQLLHYEVQTDQSDEPQVYLVSVQASALTIWTQDVDGHGWNPELDWRLSSNIHILEACSLPHVTNKIGIAAYGWEQSQFFATIFIYDVGEDTTNRFNLPVFDNHTSFKNPKDIHLCCPSSSHLLMGISSATAHTIRSVFLKEGAQGVQTTHLCDECHRGTLRSLQSCPQNPKACFGLTGDQRIVIWNHELGVVLKSIQMDTAIPCLTSILAVSSVKGFLLLTVSWRSEKSDGSCGGILMMNPITGKASKYSSYQIPNYGWKSTESMKLLDNCVVAVSSSGSVSWWNHTQGTLIGHRKSNSATCATLIRAKSILIGEVQGCVHIYSLQT